MKNLTAYYYRLMVDKLATFYFSQDPITAVLQDCGIPLGSVNLHGTARQMWDSALSYAENNGLVNALIGSCFTKYQQDRDVKSIIAGIADGSAFLPEYVFQDGFGIPSLPVEKAVLIAHQDDLWDLKGLISQLKLLQLRGLLDLTRSDEIVGPGEDRKLAHAVFMKSVSFVLVAVSPDYFSDDNCLELTFLAIQLQKTVIPVLLRECLYGRIKFLAGIQVVPRDCSFIMSSAQKSKTEMEIAGEIEKFIISRKYNGIIR